MPRGQLYFSMSHGDTKHPSCTEGHAYNEQSQRALNRST
jgi:hypothetical protein